MVYRTRGNTSPQGKPRVYFCSHPADQKVFLDATVQELLTLADCAVWYDPEPEVPLSPLQREERETDLAAMQLFVLPVTTRLLTTASSALEWEFPLAIAQHIPVLPILQEQGLERLFNEKCGDLQCLDPHQTDPTALPYEVRLKKFLESVLIGDELAAQVRAAFDAYIFLSYRKKDRREAQALMRLIHENEFCRNIAIWYDEYLTPGEDFNQAIAQALEKSQLFVLAVTPHLLERPNYVMNEEFPAAKSSGKPILPVEMVPSDRSGLEAAYPGIPPCTSGKDKPLLSEELKAALYGLALRASDSDPKHNFFIGLAYLTGIDVEVDKERAVNLIHNAAEASLPEAIEKLANMYRNGEGMAKNWDASVLWQRRLCSVRQEEWQARQSQETFTAYANALWNLSDFYFELSQPKSAQAIWEKELLSLCDKGYKMGFFNSLPYAASGYLKLGELCQTQNKPEVAQMWYEKAVEWFQALSGSIPGFRPFLAYAMSQLANLCIDREDFDMAQHWADEGMKWFLALEGEEMTAKMRLFFATNCRYQGDICMAKENLTAARHWYEKGLEAANASSQESRSIEARQSMANFYNRLGTLSLKECDISAARHWYEGYLDLTQALASEVGTNPDRRAMANGYYHLGDLCLEEGDLLTARHWYEEGLAVAQTLAQASGTDKDRQDLADTYSRLGDLCREGKDLKSARHYLEEARSIYEALAEKTDLPKMWDHLGVRLFKLATLSGVDSALLRRSLSIWKRLAKAYPDISRYSQYRDTLQQLLAQTED
ncbi:TIR domain-containing protein [uncultured Ruthenibacterium sp.]|uniref:TIR domain-containing protein n=1 Tax=uncultured Ruthenibacterium sp. TaxID=1905347 RepID=UPI00349F00E7